jgi:hypothetical protein
MAEDEFLAAVQEHLDMILTAYRDFEDKKPIILLDIQEQRIYAYPYKEFKEDLSLRNQASLTKQYEEAITTNRLVVFVRDNDQRRLVSYTIDYDRPARARTEKTKKNTSAGETKSDFLRKVLSKNIDLEYGQVNRMWAKKGRPGQISNALYYQIRQELGIVTEWRWVKES